MADFSLIIIILVGTYLMSLIIPIIILEYGGESWKIYNDVLQELLTRVQVGRQYSDITKPTK